jgi:hypothetical protein
MAAREVDVFVDEGSKRPEIEIETTPLQWVLSAIGLLALAASILFIAGAWNTLPDTVFTHFDGMGKPNGTGPKLAIAIMPALGVIVWIVLGLVIARPRTYNYPVRITSQNAHAQYEIAVNLLHWIRAEVAVLMSYLGWGMVEAIRQNSALPFGSIPMCAGLVLAITVAAGMIRSFRAK